MHRWLGVLLTLITDVADWFQVQVEDAPISGNLDHPEGGFDALMQAIVCKVWVGRL